MSEKLRAPLSCSCSLLCPSYSAYNSVVIYNKYLRHIVFYCPFTFFYLNYQCILVHIYLIGWNRSIIFTWYWSTANYFRAIGDLLAIRIL